MAIAIAIPDALYPRAWGDVISRRIVAISDSIAIKQVDGRARDNFIPTNPD